MGKGTFRISTSSTQKLANSTIYISSVKLFGGKTCELVRSLCRELSFDIEVVRCVITLKPSE